MLGHICLWAPRLEACGHLCPETFLTVEMLILVSFGTQVIVPLGVLTSSCLGVLVADALMHAVHGVKE